MSKPIPADGIPRRPPDEQVKFFADLYRGGVNPPQLAWFQARCARFGLRFSPDETIVLAALDTPAKVQEFLNTRIYYNYDHETVDQEETAMPPRLVLRTGIAHCFEGAMFAYAVTYLHGYDPRLVLLEASQDVDHNLVVWRDPRTGLYGANAHSGYPGLDGRPAEYESVRALAKSYEADYVIDRTSHSSDITLVAYSDEFDLVAKYGTAWIGSEGALWDIYYTYIDDTWRFTDIADDSGRTHEYPVIRALKESWIRIDERGKPIASPDDLPADARELWRDFWKEHGPGSGPRPTGKAREIEKEFMRLTGTTPIDLEDNAFDLQFYLAAGYGIDQLLTGRRVH